jgi:hypothetical protein
MFRRTEMLKRYDKNLVDNIANLQPLGSFANNSKNNKKFEEWLKNPDRSQEYMKINLVPNMESYGEDKFEEFIKLRKKLIFEKVKEFFQ